MEYREFLCIKESSVRWREGMLLLAAGARHVACYCMLRYGRKRKMNTRMLSF